MTTKRKPTRAEAYNKLLKDVDKQDKIYYDKRGKLLHKWMAECEKKKLNPSDGTDLWKKKYNPKDIVLMEARNKKLWQLLNKHKSEYLRK